LERESSQKPQRIFLAWKSFEIIVPIMDELVASSSLFPALVQLGGCHMLGEHHPEAPE
ncbi:hypothetical protein M91_02815, partial [Bos mutus]